MYYVHDIVQGFVVDDEGFIGVLHNKDDELKTVAMVATGARAPSRKMHSYRRLSSNEFPKMTTSVPPKEGPKVGTTPVTS